MSPSTAGLLDMWLGRTSCLPEEERLQLAYKNNDAEKTNGSTVYNPERKPEGGERRQREEIALITETQMERILGTLVRW